MTLENTLRPHLNDSLPGGFHVDAKGWSIGIVAEKKDSLSCALNELTLEKAGPIPEELRAWATRIAEDATGLLEPLALLEVDGAVGKALLRSETPTHKDGRTLYYELLLTRGERTLASLRRYAAANGERRESIPFVLTNDAIVKLVEDIVGKN